MIFAEGAPPEVITLYHVSKRVRRGSDPGLLTGANVTVCALTSDPGPEVNGRYSPPRLGPSGCGYEPGAQGVLIKGLALLLNWLLLERPAFISLAQQTTDAHRRLRGLDYSHTLLFLQGRVCLLCLRPGPRRLLGKLEGGVAAFALEEALLMAGSPPPHRLRDRPHFSH